MSSIPNKTIGQKLDEILEPFLADRARLKAQLKEQKSHRAELESQIKESERDLTVVDQALIHAVRDLARQEPLLSAAFGLRSAETPKDVIPVARPAGESNPLLNHAKAS